MPLLSDDNIENLKVGASVRKSAKVYGLESGKSRIETAQEKWNPLLEKALNLAKLKCYTYTATHLATVVINKILDDSLLPTACGQAFSFVDRTEINNKIKVNTLRRKIGKDPNIKPLLLNSKKC